ncbi:MAG TPA: acyl-CoA desaturase [Streptosporangiaceae bacterium]|nr:acyl-CoA desaturase [Streptosporangiaceae bacterium]
MTVSAATAQEDQFPAETPASRRGTDYSELSRLIRGAGLLRRRPVYYSVKISANLLFYLGGWAVFFLLGRSWWQLLVAVFLGCMFAQCGFLGHDAGHRQITGSKRIDNLIGRIHGNLLIGLSFGWWISKHNRHHSHPNQVGRDPDIAGAAIAFTRDQADARRGMGIWLARYQAWLFFPMLLLEGLHLHVAGLRVLLSRRRSTAKLLEGGLLIAHVLAFLAIVFWVLSPLQAVIFIAIQQGVFGVYLGCAFAPNHKGMPVLGENEKMDFLRRQVITSRNIKGGRFTDFLLGGLNYQVEHHLFPSMPRPSLRHAQAPVRAFCESLGIAYHETGLIASYAQVLRHLDDIGTDSE